VRESLLGPCSLPMVALDTSTSDTHTHTLRTQAQITSAAAAAAAAAMHKDTGLAHRLADVALAPACDRMRQLPVSQKTNAVSVPSPPPLP
jgi:hypothetical protein